MSKLETRVIQVTNVAPTTTKEQLKTLFQFIGRIREVRVFPPEGTESQVAAKVCYIEFDDSTSAAVSLHLTNTVFIDRALMVVPVMEGKIPDDKVAFQLTPQAVSKVTSGMPAWPANVVSQLSGTGSNQAITTYDPRLNALGLPQYPPLPSNLDAAKVEEIRRTVYIGNLDPKTTPENLISFFSQAGEVKYLRMAGSASAGVRAAYLELTDQRSVPTALGYNGVNYNGRTITVSHSKACIAKPLSKSQEASRREVEEAMKKVKEAQSLISAAAGGMQRSRSRSRSRRRSRSRGYSRSRSRSRGRRSRSRGRRRRSRSRSRRKSRSPRRRRSRSRGSPRRRRSRSRSGIVVIPAREPRRRRSRSRGRRSRSRSGSRRRSRTPPKAYTSGSRRSRSRDRSKSPKRRKRSRSGSFSPKRKRSPSPRKRRSKSRSRTPVKKKKARSPRRSRSGSRHRSKKDKKKDRSRSRDRKDKKEKKKSSKDKKDDKGKVKVERNYDEEEKGFNSASDREEEMRSPPKHSPARSTGGDHMDIDTSD